MKTIAHTRKPPRRETIGALTTKLLKAGFTARHSAKRMHYEHASGAHVAIVHSWHGHDTAPWPIRRAVTQAVAQATRSGA